MNSIRQLNNLQQLILILSIIGATQSMYGDLVGGHWDAFHTRRLFSLVSESVVEDKATINEFIVTIKHISQPGTH